MKQCQFQEGFFYFSLNLTELTILPWEIFFWLQQSIYHIFQKLNESLDKTLILVSHDINMASLYCSRLIVLKNGRILRDGSPQDVIQKDVIEEAYDTPVRVQTDTLTGHRYILMDKSKKPNSVYES